MSDARAGDALLVTTHNIGNGLIPPTRLVAALRAYDASIVGLQEVDARQAEALVELDDVYPHRIVRGTGFSGRALLSRFPIVEETWLELAADRPDLWATVDVDGRRLGVAVAHPAPPRLGVRGVVFDPRTVAQLRTLANLTASSAPAVLMGDLNLTPRHPLYRVMAASLVDSFADVGAGWGATFPLRPGRLRRFDHSLTWVPLPPFARVDYIWHTPDIGTVAAWVGDGAGSDHRPVSARLALPTLSTA